jgi:nucleoside 2-deoxyribosyltransferase
MTTTNLKVYVAGKTHDMRHVQEVQSLVRRYGTVTHDWTSFVEKHGPDAANALPQALAKECARNDMRGVLNADLIIALPFDRLCGTLIEVGAAISHGIPVLWLGQPSQRSVFWANDKIYRTADLWPCCEHDLNDVLQFITTHPHYDSPNYTRDLWRLTETNSETGHITLHPVDVEGTPEKKPSIPDIALTMATGLKLS